MSARRSALAAILANIMLAAAVAMLAACESRGGRADEVESPDEEACYARTHPGGERPSLVVFTSARADGEVLLEWAGSPQRGPQHWEYRYQYHLAPYVLNEAWDTEDLGAYSGEWLPIPQKRPCANSYRVSGLEPRASYSFQVRAQGRKPSESVAGIAQQRGADGVPYGTGAPLERGETYRLCDRPYFTVTVPERGTWSTFEWRDGCEVHESETGYTLLVDSYTGRELLRPEGGPAWVHKEFDKIVASIRWVPERPDPPLVALAGGGEREVVLRWRPCDCPAEVERWQYRLRESREGWSEWTDMTGSDGHTTSHRLTDLSLNVSIDFQVRPWTSAGPDSPYAPFSNVTLRSAASDGTVWAARGELLEDGRTFMFPGGRLFDVPVGARLLVFSGGGHILPDLLGGAVVLDVRTGSWLLIDTSSGVEVERHIRSGRMAMFTFDRIVDSLRLPP